MDPASAAADGASARLDAHGVLRLVAGLHHRPEDLRDGDLAHRIHRYRAYERRRLLLAALDLGEFLVDEELVAAYAALPGVAPPIVFDPLAGSIIDGVHRANACARRGSVDVDAWVGIPAEQDPDWAEDDDQSED